MIVRMFCLEQGKEGEKENQDPAIHPCFRGSRQKCKYA